MTPQSEKRLQRITSIVEGNTGADALLNKKGEVTATKKQVDAAFKRICGNEPKRFRFHKG